MKIAAVLFSILIIAIIILADRGQLGPIRWLYDFPYGDKAGHVILFGLLNFFITRAFLASPRFRNRNLLALSIGLVLALLIGAEEYSQKYFADRTFDLVDLTASYIGLLLGGWAALRRK